MQGFTQVLLYDIMMNNLTIQCGIIAPPLHVTDVPAGLQFCCLQATKSGTISECNNVCMLGDFK